MNWYYLENGTQCGPITDAEFEPLSRQGVINAGTFLWCEGMADWKTYGELTGAVAAQPVAVAAVAESASGLRVHREAAPAQAAEVGCTSCRAIVPSGQVIMIGAATLCPKCAVARQRAATVGGDYAPPALRIVAYIIDWVLVVLVFFGALNGARWVLSRLINDQQTRHIVALAFFGLLILWALDYFSGRVSRNGGTTGQRLMGLHVVGANGANISFLRALGRFVMMLIIDQFTLSLAQLVSFFDAQKRCLHDIICGTVVLKK